MSGLAPTARSEILHEGPSTRVTRLFLDGRTAIRKQHLGPDAHRRLQNETAMLRRLRGVAGVVQLLDGPEYPGSVVMEDTGGRTIAESSKPLPVDELLELARSLVRAVAAMHARGVMHGDINPSNILLAGDRAVLLIDFALAAPVAELPTEFRHPGAIAGTLPYVAPEQTGRMGRSADQRADLYSLGATLYELATGEPPFGSGDPMRVIHDHLTRVPVAPRTVNPKLAAPFSDIVMHLLEKEPDRRYQTADGVIYDLERMPRPGAGVSAANTRIGEHDVQPRLRPPSSLVGREDEMAALTAALDDVRGARCRGVLIGGAAGVGKTALIDQLRPEVTQRGGWYLAGKFDQYRRDHEFAATYQAFRVLVRRLLAEPEDELATLRERILAAVGANGGLLAAVLPDFASLLGVAPDPGDPLTRQSRLPRASVAVLKAVASRHRPLVLVFDDMQWAGRRQLNIADLLLTEEPIDGVLLVGAYREGDAADPLASALPVWCGHPAVRELHLGNLARPSLVAMVSEMIRADGSAASGLVDLIEPLTHGNPFETVELLGALRQQGILRATPAGWRWDAGALRRHLARSSATEPVAGVLASMPTTSRLMLEAMACLGGRAELSLLQAATGEPARLVHHALAPALDEAIVVAEAGEPEAVRFRHDRIREAILQSVDVGRRRALQLEMARRLGAEPARFAAAAQQYMLLVDAIDEPVERAHVVDLLERAADQAKLVGDHAMVNALLVAAIRLINPDEGALRPRLHLERHAALYGLGRLEEADDEYHIIENLPATTPGRAEATAVQVRSLTQRKHFAEAVELGVGSLHEFGIDVPESDRVAGELDRQFQHLYQWLDKPDAADRLDRPEVSDPILIAVSALLDAVLPAAYFATDLSTHGWLSLEALRIWIERDPIRTLVGAASHTAYAAMALRADHAAGYRAVQRILKVGEARGYEPGSSEARFLFALQSCWFEPIETVIQTAQRARHGLIAGGDLATAGYTYHLTAAGVLDCGPTLDACVTEVAAGLAFVRRTGGEQSSQWLGSYEWLAGAMRGEHAVGEPIPAETYAGNPAAHFHAHLNRAIAAAVFGDLIALGRHTTAAMELLPAVLGLYTTAAAHAMRGLYLALQARRGRDWYASGPDDDARAGVLSELDEVTRWLAARAGDAPDNFMHLLRLVEAERARAHGDFRATALAFDAARRELDQRQRPWHRALILERAARFYLVHGLEQAGYELLAESRHQYLAWGATAKADQLDWAYPTFAMRWDASTPPATGRAPDPQHHRSTVTAGPVDLIGVLETSQALSLQTSIGGLQRRVVQVLGAMTGATGVQLALWSEDRQDWLIPDRGGERTTIPVGRTGREPDLPMSVLRYVQRTREPLIIADATADERFARDPYFERIDSCSLLAVPILTGGLLRGVLLLENRLIRSAFSTGRLDTVKLIAGHLAVSLANAELYAEFRQIADEQAALRRVATLVAQGAAPATVFDAVAGEMAALLSADGITLCRYEPGGAFTVLAHVGPAAALLPPGTHVIHDSVSVSATVRRTERPARMDSYAQARGQVRDVVDGLGFRSGVGVPIIVDGTLWGVTIASWTGTEPPPGNTEERMAQFAELLDTAFANADTRDQLMASRARLLVAEDSARRRVVRDLHDGAQQSLVNTIVTLKLAKRALPGDLERAESMIARGLDQAEKANAELRELAHGILPGVLTQGGLEAGVDALASRLPIPVTTNIVTPRLEPAIEASAYFVVAEALTNVVKHAHATRTEVTASVGAGTLRVEIRDDGVGGADPGGHGIVGMSDRITALGGRLAFDSPVGGGTHVTAVLPLPSARQSPLSALPHR